MMDSISRRRFLQTTAFVEARKIKIDHYFVEQEPPFSEMPPMQAIKVSYDYLHSLNV